VNESQLISELCAALDDAAATVRAPGGTARRVRERVRRRRLARGLAVGVPAAGLAAGLAVAVSSPLAPVRPQPPRVQATARTHQPPVLTVANVTSRARSALSRAHGLIEEIHGHGYVQWQDLATAATRLEEFGAGGRLVSDEMRTFSGRTQQRVYVDYVTRTWWRLISQVPVVPKKPAPPDTLPVAGASAGGQVSILGHRNLAGRDTILVQYGPPPGFRPSASVQWPTEQVWLDSATYLPLKTRITGIGPVEEQTLAWLQATSGNVAKLSFTPPAGFRRVAPPPFRGDGRPGLGQIP
jgi:hypothetical protein